MADLTAEDEARHALDQATGMAAELAEITANLDGYIEARAQEIAKERIAREKDRADRRIADVRNKLVTALRREKDLTAELRRQMKPLIRHVEETCPAIKERRARTAAAHSNAVRLDVGADRDLFLQAAEMVIDAQHVNVSWLQRRMHVGFAKAGRLMDLLEQAGVIGTAAPTGGHRQVLVPVESRDTAVERLRKEIKEATHG